MMDSFEIAAEKNRRLGVLNAAAALIDNERVEMYTRLVSNGLGNLLAGALDGITEAPANYYSLAAAMIAGVARDATCIQIQQWRLQIISHFGRLAEAADA